jgi:uncharacterized protein
MKPVLIFLGSFFVLLGIVGIIIPLIPTTPFLLLAAFFYAKSSDKLYHWLLNTKWLGEYIKSFQSGEGIPRRAKYIAIIVLWLTTGYSIFFLIPIIWVKLIMSVVVINISIYIWSIKSKEAIKATRHK